MSGHILLISIYFQKKDIYLENINKNIYLDNKYILNYIN